MDLLLALIRVQQDILAQPRRSFARLVARGLSREAAVLLIAALLLRPAIRSQFPPRLIYLLLALSRVQQDIWAQLRRSLASRTALGRARAVALSWIALLRRLALATSLAPAPPLTGRHF